MKYDLLIFGGTVIDGTGESARRADVGIKNGKIVAVGSGICENESRIDVFDGLSRDRIIGRGLADRVINASGMIVCPGLIDTHCHTDMYAMDCPDAEGKILQGVTTDICGLCGDSPAPIGQNHLDEYQSHRTYQLPGGQPVRACTFAEYRNQMNQQGNATNMVPFVGNANLRIEAVGYEDRAANAFELDHMKGVLRESMEDGAWGLSTGLTYVPSMFSSEDELVQLCKVVAPFDGIYNSHMRNEGDRVLESIREVIVISEKSGCRGHVSHLKVSGQANHGKSYACLDLIHQANNRGVPITFDVYPYTAGSCGLRTLLPPEMLEKGIENDEKVLLNSAVCGQVSERLLENDWDNLLRGCGSDNIVVSTALGHPEYEGRTIANISQNLDICEAEAILRVLAATRGQATIIYYALCEEDLVTFMKDPLCTIGTDAFARRYQGPTAVGRPHPRNYGGFARMIRRYLLDKKIMPLEKGIEKMTSVAAEHFSIPDRGKIAPGYWGDILIFDPDTIRETGTFENPVSRPDGICWVLVSGKPAVVSGSFSDVRGGRVLSARPGSD